MSALGHKTSKCKGAWEMKACARENLFYIKAGIISHYTVGRLQKHSPNFSSIFVFTENNADRYTYL